MPEIKPRDHYEKVRQEFADWKLLTKQQKKLLGLPMSMAEFARVKQVGERTVRRWESDPGFHELVAQRRDATEVANVPLKTAFPSVGDESTIEGSFAFAWQRLQALIANGDKAALQMFFNSPLAKSVMEAQLEQSKSDFADLTDGQLVVKITETLTDDELVAAVEGRGFTCSRAGGGDSQADG